MKFGTSAIIAGITIGIILLAGCKSSSMVNPDAKQCYDGNLKLVARYEPLHLYIYADTTSTNRFPEFEIGEGRNPIYIRESKSNKIVVRQFDKNNEVLMTEYDNDGNVLDRNVNFWDGYDPKFSYVDTNGDGLFDFFINGYKKPIVYARSNLCWVPIVRK